MTVASLRKPFNFARWIDAHCHLLKPPVATNWYSKTPVWS
jgi:hypothetical protein